MQCPYCNGRISMLKKSDTCPHCQKEIVMKFDYKILLKIGFILSIFFSLMTVIFGLSGILKNILFGVVIGFSIVPGIYFMPKDPQTDSMISRLEVKIWKPVVFGCITLFVLSICLGLLQSGKKDKTEDGKTIQVVAPDDMSEEDLKQLLQDKDLQKFINEK